MSVTIEHSVIAKCAPEHAWQKFQMIEEWPWWNRVVGRARWIDGQPWQKGSRLSLEIAYPKRMALKPAITENNTPRAIAWAGDNASMRFDFEPQSDGQTVLKAQAEFSGLKTVFGGGALRGAVQQMFTEWLAALKTEAEKIAREELARSSERPPT
jgi:hypothetical protein